ncbi:sugar phosphate isomerase/epimerase family protein [Paenibacillus gansuensis]|uniref:Sugar phosphate isomerase/epimerase family protein n=1 Tax=Paenibacillus gansuensis TaxID=306542 RepID=A0ABW5P9M6_9BACL
MTQIAIPKITCFADEISHDLDEQMDVLEAQGVKHLELRGLWGKNVLELTPEELDRIRYSLRQRGFAVSSIGSPIGKYPLADEFQPQLEALETAINAANALETPYIRIFSFHPPEGANLDECRTESLWRMESLVKLAEQHKMVLLLENDSNLYGSAPERCLELLRHCASPSLRMAFDPGNFVRAGSQPMTEAYPLLKEYVDYIHVKDSTEVSWVPAGSGLGQLPELLTALKDREYHGYLSVEPHLHQYLPHSSNPKRVVTAIRALQQLLKNENIDWE